jgi:serine/threonine protein kinase/Tfp pilus assembly protein PilF
LVTVWTLSLVDVYISLPLTFLLAGAILRPDREEGIEGAGMDLKKFPDKTITMGSTGGTAREIGPYHLLQKIGEGGMGEVWVAEQEKPIQRRVALKLIKAGMDTRQVIARFESERQALAMMDHPAIAKVFAAGETEDGRPYFVMEYVQGVPITAYCDQNRLTTQERLELFKRVCDGVQHAHQKAIIHRDLKPSNILVAIQGEAAVPKIIDFGVAKATAQSLTERTMFTELGMIVGTPEYMSPEQAEMSGQNVDTRTDVYSLGAILYELLVGALPLDSKELRRAGFDEIRRKIREEDPPKPSTKLSTMGEALATQAQNRRTERPALIRQIRGDLDWITMKALEKDRTRRYGSPADFAADIERYLHHQPIIARPPSAVYKTKKFVRRHRIGVGVAASLAVLLVAFSGTTAIQARRIALERDRANQEAETSKQVSEFLTSLFKVSDPSEARGNSITAREILDKGADKIARDLQGQPIVQARLMDTMGQVYHSLGLFDQALPLLKSALDVRRNTLNEKNLDVASSLQALGYLLIAKGDYAAAEPSLRESLAIRREILGSNHPDVATSLATLGELNYYKGDLDAAERFYREALAVRRQAPGEVHLEVADSLNDLAITLKAKGNYDEAGPMYRESLAIRRKGLGEDHPAIAQSLNNLGMFLYQEFLNKKNDGAEAELLLRQALELNRRILGPNHPEVSTNINNLGLLLRDRGDLDQAISLFREGIELDRKNLGEGHPYVSSRMNNLASALVRKGDYLPAENLFRQSLVIQRITFSEKSWQIATTKLLLGGCLQEIKRFPEAESLLLEAFPIIRDSFGLTHARTKSAIRRLISLYEAWGKSDRASEYKSLLDIPAKK